LPLPEIERQQAEGQHVAFRADAAFAKPDIYEALEKRGVQYAIRIPANESLEREIAELPFPASGTARPQAFGALQEFFREMPWNGGCSSRFHAGAGNNVSFKAVDVAR
jgi:hypothetical protein